jgi:type IV pilus assembly protein PilN
MIHINLLPWREEQRDAIKKSFTRQFIVAIVGSIVAIIALHFWLSSQVGQQNFRKQYLQTQTNEYDARIKKIGQLQQLRDKVNQRVSIIHQLQFNRALIVNLFSTFIAIAPDGVYFTAINRSGNILEFFGKADSNSQVSQLMRHVEQSAWLQAGKLRVIKNDDKSQFHRVFELQAQEKTLTTTPTDKDKAS